MFDKAMLRNQPDADLLRDIKRLWDAEGFGSDCDVSEPLYARLCAAIKRENSNAR